jgi:hypothetical protein
MQAVAVEDQVQPVRQRLAGRQRHRHPGLADAPVNEPAGAQFLDIIDRQFHVGVLAIP